MKMKKMFTIINDELFAVKENGYKIDSQDTAQWDEDRFPNGMFSNRLANMVDSLYDLDSAKLCKDENDEMYAVVYEFRNGRFVPAVWQRVERA